MALAWSQIPHVTSQDEADITDLEALRRKHKASVQELGGKLTFTVFVLKALASALKRFPHFNASLDAGADELIVKDYIHIGVATDTEDGLIVPVVRDVDQKSITELAVELTELAGRTRERKTAVEEMQGGSFTLTNIGAIGGGHFTPIINYPQVAILGTGGAKMKPVVRENPRGGHVIVPRLMLPMVIAIDHRVLDGADSVRFLRTVIEMIEDPEKMLLRTLGGSKFEIRISKFEMVRQAHHPEQGRRANPKFEGANDINKTSSIQSDRWLRQSTLFAVVSDFGFRASDLRFGPPVR
jgi:pyruvate dehydrogenase E2 component (dihydrolipoamide acetyltransferase)